MMKTEEDKSPSKTEPEIATDESDVVTSETEKSEPKNGDIESGDVRKRSLRSAKVGGVAPLLNGPSRWVRWRTTRQLARRGFVALTPGRPKLYRRILPRTVIGISAMLMSAGIGAAFSGAAFYAYYDDRLAQNEEQVATFVDGFETQFTDASGAIDALRVESVEQIRRELGPLGGYIDDTNGILVLPQEVGPSIWTLTTVSESGITVVGSAFAVVGHNGGTAMVTSYELVKASTVAPSPTITLTKGDETMVATIWSWDADRDLALIVVDQDVPKLELASVSTRANSTGGRLFAVSGVGGQGATASPGFLIDQSNLGLQHTVPVGTVFSGGPLVNGAGMVMGVSSLSYEPLGVDGGAVTMAADVSMICERLLRCAEEANEIVVEIPEVLESDE